MKKLLLFCCLITSITAFGQGYVFDTTIKIPLTNGDMMEYKEIINTDVLIEPSPDVFFGTKEELDEVINLYKQVLAKSLIELWEEYEKTCGPALFHVPNQRTLFGRHLSGGTWVFDQETVRVYEIGKDGAKPTGSLKALRCLEVCNVFERWQLKQPTFKGFINYLKNK